MQICYRSPVIKEIKDICLSIHCFFQMFELNDINEIRQINVKFLNRKHYRYLKEDLKLDAYRF